MLEVPCCLTSCIPCFGSARCGGSMVDGERASIMCYGHVSQPFREAPPARASRSRALRKRKARHTCDSTIHPRWEVGDDSSPKNRAYELQHNTIARKSQRGNTNQQQNNRSPIPYETTMIHPELSSTMSGERTIEEEELRVYRTVPFTPGSRMRLSLPFLMVFELARFRERLLASLSFMMPLNQRR